MAACTGYEPSLHSCVPRVCSARHRGCTGNSAPEGAHACVQHRRVDPRFSCATPPPSSLPRHPPPSPAQPPPSCPQGYATALSVIFTGIISTLFFGSSVDIYFVIAVVFVACSVSMYNQKR